jgi:pimeloyl-ACP methyl ester carboxylesterase
VNTRLYRYIWPYLVNGYTGEMTPPRGRDKVNNAMKNAPRYVARSFFAEMLHEETAYDDAMAAPLLAIYAEHPRWTSEVRNRIRSINDRTTLVMMPGVSHFLMLDKPDETNRLLADFVANCGPASL